MHVPIGWDLPMILVIALNVGLGALGDDASAIGHTVADVASAGDLGIVVRSPVDGAVISTMTVAVDGISRRSSGILNVVVTNGNSVLGSAALVLRSAGRFHIAIPVRWTSYAAGTRVVVTWVASHGTWPVTSRGVRLCPGCA